MVFEKGHKFGRRFKKGQTAWNKGMKGLKVGNWTNHPTGEEHWNWKGGITSFNRTLRNKSLWRIWREAVFLRDNFTCQNKDCNFCENKMGVKLHPHHIKPLSIYPELTFILNNGITYCAGYHLKGGIHIGLKHK